ncbi:MAG TPA: rod shape-determining protein MreD [Gammaproteobacteria bacterium]|nr:rod shape-determining protein MreD [Gammaproteobacteria bacterium]
MRATPWRTFWIVSGTLVLALLLTLLPLPNWMEALRPAWVELVLIYWAMFMPASVGLFAGFIFGLIVDIALGSLLGQHALGLSLVTYIVLKNHQKLRIYPLIQQGVIIMFILMIEQVLYLWIHGISNQASGNAFVYFIPAVTSMILWPWLFVLMRDIRRRFLPTPTQLF